MFDIKQSCSLNLLFFIYIFFISMKCIDLTILLLFLEYFNWKQLFLRDNKVSTHIIPNGTPQTITHSNFWVYIRRGRPAQHLAASFGRADPHSVQGHARLARGPRPDRHVPAFRFGADFQCYVGCNIQSYLFLIINTKYIHFKRTSLVISFKYNSILVNITDYNDLGILIRN